MIKEHLIDSTPGDCLSQFLHIHSLWLPLDWINIAFANMKTRRCQLKALHQLSERATNLPGALLNAGEGVRVDQMYFVLYPKLNDGK